MVAKLTALLTSMTSITPLKCRIKQKQQIYKYVLEKGSITTAETVEILDVKHRRARAVLLNMVKDGYLRKEGVARSTIYVKKLL